MKGFCPSCEKETELNRVHRVENLNIKGEDIPVDVDIFVCTECGADFDIPDPGYDPLQTAYDEYRRRKGMVQPQEIKALRDRYDLTQRELSKLAGFGGATLSRYENGSLQDEAHDTLLRLLLHPKNLLNTVETKKSAIEPQKRNRLIQQLQLDVEKQELIDFLAVMGYSGNPTPYNGYKVLDINKLLSVLKRLCYRVKVAKTKLNKLLFYVDFLHFKNLGQSLTGLCYARLPLGPVPDQYECIYDALLKLDPSITKIEEPVLDHFAEYYLCETEPDNTGLSYEEAQVVFQVIDRFRMTTAKEIINISHQEEGYLQTPPQGLISYQFAEQLKI